LLSRWLDARLNLEDMDEDGRPVILPGTTLDVPQVATIKHLSRHYRDLATDSQFVASLAHKLRTTYPGLRPSVQIYDF